MRNFLAFAASRPPTWNLRLHRLHYATDLLAISLVLVSLSGCNPRTAPSASSTAVNSTPWLKDVTDHVGLKFERDGGSVETFEMPQIMGAGGGVFDYDGDGDLDVFLVGGGPFPQSSKATSIGSRLFRQESDGRYVDVTEQSGLKNPGYGMGIAVADVDNDGDLDVFLSNVGDDRFFVNQGNGTFRDETQLAGVSDPNWSTACSFVDYDRDGWLDLVVVNYVDYFNGSPCYDRSGRRDFCGPQAFQGTVDRLYRNRGAWAQSDGPRFEDVTVSSGLASAVGRGLGVICIDFNDDERPDILVANDMEPNRLWIQQSDGTFRDEAVLRGVSVNQMGQAEANMGVVFDDLNDDGRFDLFITHLRGESNTLWKGEPGGIFVDITPRTGLGPPSVPMTGFGVAAIDLNLDGLLDLLVANGHVKRPSAIGRVASANADFWSSYAQPNQVFLQVSSGVYRSDSQPVGEFCTTEAVFRGLIYGDLDNDGDHDVVVSTAQGLSRVYRNDAPRNGSWLMIRAVDPLRYRDAYGAKIMVETSGRKWTRAVQPSSSYLSHHDARVHFGLGSQSRIERVTIQWPDSNGDIIEDFSEIAVNQSIEIKKGTGRIRKLPE